MVRPDTIKDRLERQKDQKLKETVCLAYARMRKGAADKFDPEIFDSGTSVLEERGYRVYEVYTLEIVESKTVKKRLKNKS